MPQVTTKEVLNELVGLNAIDIPPVPDELLDFAKANPVYIFNVSPETFHVEHPLVGRLTIKACEDGKPYSEPTIIPGLLPYGVRVEMQTADLRHESGRQFAVDIIGVGAFKDRRYSLMRRGIFIAANDTFDPDDMVVFKLGKGNINLPRWVNLKHGQTAKKPTVGELERAHKLAENWDFEKIAEADVYQDQGPSNPLTGTGNNNISVEHRQAARRRKQSRVWLNETNVSYITCPGCQENIKPGMVKHSCGAVLDPDKALKLNMITQKEYDTMKGKKETAA